MTNKEKALAHVRSVCPELMELSLGCAFINPERVTEFDDGQDWIVRSLATWNHDINKSENDDLYEGLIGGETDIIDCEIIGHTPHLEHWLRGIGKRRSFELSSTGDEMLVVIDWTAPTTRVLYDLTKPGDEQSEEFYQAYNQIVGI